MMMPVKSTLTLCYMLPSFVCLQSKYSFFVVVVVGFL